MLVLRQIIIKFCRHGVITFTLTISFFETQEQAAESTRRAAEWVKQNLAPLAAGPHEIVAVGEVRFRKAR